MSIAIVRAGKGESVSAGLMRVRILEDGGHTQHRRLLPRARRTVHGADRAGPSRSRRSHGPLRHEGFQAGVMRTTRGPRDVPVHLPVRERR